MLTMTKGELLGQYARRVASLEETDGLGTEEELVVLTRDSVADCAWSSQEQAEIDRLDKALISRWEQFEGVLPNPNFTDRARWWWFLHEGPQVREQAKLLDKESAPA